MALAELNAERYCSICQQIYTDPVALKCGHNFCRICIEDKLKEQDEDEFYTCPTCGKRFSSRPSLQTNRDLSDMAPPEQITRENSNVLCMYCSLSAVKTCLTCVGTLCDGHLADHNKTHRFIDPTSLESRRCPLHNHLLHYYCTKDDVCICPDCIALGDHKGHNVESLDEACKKKKEKMQKVLDNLVSKREDAKEKIRELSVHESKEKEKANLQEEQVIDRCKDLIEQIQKDVLKHISHCEEKIVQTVQGQITKLKEQDNQLSKRIVSIAELYKIDDPLCVLQNWKSDGEEIGNPEEMSLDTKLPTFEEIDVSWLLQNILTQHTSKRENGMLNPVSPNTVETSNVVPENVPSSVLMEDSLKCKRKQASSRGTVLIYCKPVTKAFLIHVYLVPMSKPRVKEVIEKKETRFGFRWIDKPPYIKSVSTHIAYTIDASEEVNIENKNLHCLHSASELYPYAEIRVPEKCTTVHLHISEEGKKAKIWSCVLNEEDLYGNPGTSTCNSPSGSGKGKIFLQNNYRELCKRLGLLESLLLSLREQGIIDEDEEGSIRSKKLKLQQRRTLLEMVTKKGVEEKFYEILKHSDPCLVQSLGELPKKS